MPRFLCRLLRHPGRWLEFRADAVALHNYDASRAKTPFGHYMVVCDRCGVIRCLG